MKELISYIQYIKAKHIGVLEILFTLIGFIFLSATDVIGMTFSISGFVIYYLTLSVFLLVNRDREYKELLKEGELVYGKVISSRRTLLAYRGMINNSIKIQITNKGKTIILRSEYKLLLSTYKQYPCIIGKKVKVLLNPNDITNYYIFHEDLFDNEGFR